MMDTPKRRQNSYLIIIVVMMILTSLFGCGPSREELEAVDYAPLPGDDWKVSTPAEQGLDPMLVAKLYHNAAELETLYGLLVIKNDHLIAEGYFNDGSINQVSNRQSATKSFTSALVGVALDQGCLSSVDQKMMDFFPEYANQITDSRKNQVTIRDLLQMRAGYPWEEITPPYFEELFFSEPWPYHFIPHLVDFPLVSNPGTEFQYSNLMSHLLGVIVQRACDTDLESFAQENLLTPIGAQVGDWYVEADNYNTGSMGILITARNMAKFGLLYLNNGEFEGKQVLSAKWVEDSLQRYSEGMNFSGWIPGITSYYGSFHNLGYGYQWWSATKGRHNFNYASGHGGNYIVLLDDLDMVIVTTAYPFETDFGDWNWEYESAINKLVADFIASLPSE